VTDLTQFRADFKAMFSYWRKTGEISEREAAQQYAEAASAVQDHMHDNDWMKCAAAHFRRLVEQTESEANRASQIAAAVRAERE
jgi:hypothetical protein